MSLKKLLRNKVFLSFLLVFLGSVSFVFSQNENICYCEALMPDQYELYKDTVLIKPATTRIVRPPYGKVPVTETIVINDGTDSMRYEYRTLMVISSCNPAREITIPAEYIIVEKKRMVKEGGFYEDVKVICEKDLTKEKLNLIRIKLAKFGYPIDNFTTLKQALKDYQTNHDLPVGQFDFQSMKHLGIEF